MPYQLSRRQLLLDLYQAYKDARRHKRNKPYQKHFESRLELNLRDLAEELWIRTYKPRPSTCFIIEEPKKREVFAAVFRDRIVHHLYFNYVHEMLERTFIHDSYSCIKGRGTHFGINRLEQSIRKESQNYQEQCYILKMDIQGYFMHINREKLLKITLRQIEKMGNHRVSKYAPKTWAEVVDMDFVRWLSGEIILLNPVNDCVRRGRSDNWRGLPNSKSLFHSPPGCGLPIGNLTSQLFSNVYLNDFDQFMKRVLRCRHYGRYVDDFYVVSADREWLCSLQKPVATFLRERLGLEVNLGKTVIHDVRYGVGFLGAFLKPFRRYASNSTLRRMRRKLPLLEKQECTPEHLCNSLNSFLGILSHYRSYRLRRKMFLNYRRYNACGLFSGDMRKYTLYSAFAAVFAVLLLSCPVPLQAQTGIDSLGTGGSLGGDSGNGGSFADMERGGDLGDDPDASGTDDVQAIAESSAKTLAADSPPEYYTLDGRRIRTPRRGEVYIVRWRERGVWRKGKYTNIGCFTL